MREGAGQGIGRRMRALAEGALGRLREERGNVAVVVAGGIVALCGFAALSVDVGRGYAALQRLQDVADAAALAGARHLPGDAGAADRAAREVAALNGVEDPDGSRVRVSFPDASTIRVEIRDTVPFYFAPVVSAALRTVQVQAHALAGAEGVSAIGPRRPGGGAGGGAGGGGGGTEERWDEVRGGVVPLGVEWGNWVPGEAVELKLGAGQGVRGNYHALKLGDDARPGADRYRDNLRYGYDGVVRIGDEPETEPGNMRGPTRDGVAWRLDLDPGATWDTVRPGSPRVVYVPVVTGFRDAQGRDRVRVEGFAAFFLEGVGSDGSVQGRFLEWTVEGEPGGPDYGLKRVRLKG